MKDWLADGLILLKLRKSLRDSWKWSSDWAGLAWRTDEVKLPKMCIVLCHVRRYEYLPWTLHKVQLSVLTKCKGNSFVLLLFSLFVAFSFLLLFLHQGPSQEKSAGETGGRL